MAAALPRHIGRSASVYCSCSGPPAKVVDMRIWCLPLFSCCCTRLQVEVELCILEGGCAIWCGLVNPRDPSSLSRRMYCPPLCDNGAMNVGYAHGSDSSAEQTCQLSRDVLPSDSVEKGLALYCKPFILYQNIQERAKHNPSFLRRCLHYMIHAKQKKRIQITISLSGNTNAELQSQNMFPVYALFATTISDDSFEGHSPLYRFNRACLLTSFSESGSNKHTEATFIIPDRAHSFDIILVSCGQVGQTFDKLNCSEDHIYNSSLQKLEGKCFWGKIPDSSIRSRLVDRADLIVGHTHEFSSTIDMSPGFMVSNILEQDCRLVFCSQKFNDMCSYQLRVTICAEETGSKDVFNSSYRIYSYNKLKSSSLKDVRRRVGNVSFNYIHDNNFSEEEVTEDFICIICLKKCGNFKGLEFHLLSSHDLFSFDFKISEEKQAVYIRLKHHTRTDQLFPEAIDPRHGTFSYFSKYRKRGRLVTGTEMIVLPNTTEMIVLPKTTEMINQAQLVEYAQADFENGHVQKNNGISVADVSVAPDNSLHGGSLSPQKVLQFGKTRKRRVDQIDPRKRELLQKRQIFHSHKVQRMSLEDVLADHDSEGEIDDDVVDLEERKMLDTYSDITKDEKHIMHMWNSFVRTQRVIADSHMPWACKAFSEHHGPLLVQNPSLRRSWRLVMIKFWNHNLLDARTMDACNRLLDDMENKSIVPVVNAE